MARRDHEPTIRLSILDRLIDDDPGASVDAHVSPRKQLRQLRLAIRRDIQDLLNTRKRCTSCPEHLASLRSSVLEYGLNDISTAALGSGDGQAQLLEDIQETIRHFEPRFKFLRVLPHADRDSDDRTLHFRIEAVVYAEPAPEEVIFDSMVMPVTRSVEVKA